MIEENLDYGEDFEDISGSDKDKKELNVQFAESQKITKSEPL